MDAQQSAQSDQTRQVARLVGTANALMERYARAMEELESIRADLSNRLELLEIAVRESSEDEANAIKGLAAKLKRLEELELLKQVGREDGTEAKGLKGSIRDEHDIEHLEEMLVTVTKNLQRAQLRAARRGPDNTDYATLSDIEEFSAAVEEIQTQLKELRKRKTGQRAV